MKTLYKSAPPNALTRYATDYPANEWGEFRDHAALQQTPGDDYRAIKHRLIEDQGGLCGYCEEQIGQLDANLQRIEHYHPKSDKSDPAVNWALLWSNVLLVCMGGEQAGGRFPLPQNLSCDAHKAHFFGNAAPSLQAQALDALIAPFDMPAFPCLFGFDMRTGVLLPSLAGAEQIDQARLLPPGTTHAALTETVKVLNLNCDRLCQSRLKVRDEYNRLVKVARESSDIAFREKLAVRWFSKRWPSFFTTRRILLGDAAEDYLREMGFRG